MSGYCSSRFPQKWWSQVVLYMKCLIMFWPLIGSYWRYGWTRTWRRRRAPCKLSYNCLTTSYLDVSLSMKICAQRKAGKSIRSRRASPAFFTLPMVSCVSSPVTRVLRSPLCETVGKTKRLRRRLAVLDNTRPTLSKTFQDFGFFCDVCQSNCYRSIHCVCK